MARLVVRTFEPRIDDLLRRQPPAVGAERDLQRRRPGLCVPMCRTSSDKSYPFRYASTVTSALPFCLDWVLPCCASGASEKQPTASIFKFAWGQYSRPLEGAETHQEE